MKKRLLITSIVMMLVVAVALSTATYAWFTSNANVTASSISMTAATNNEAALAIKWDTGTYGTSIATTEAYPNLLPMIPNQLTAGTTILADSGENHITFLTGKLNDVGGVPTFKSVDSATPSKFATKSTDTPASKDIIFVKNSSSANIVYNLNLKATLTPTYIACTSGELAVEGYTYYANSTGGALDSQPSVGTAVPAGAYKATTALVRIAVFTRDLDSTGTDDTTSAFIFRGVLASTAADTYIGTIANNGSQTTYKNTESNKVTAIDAATGVNLCYDGGVAHTLKAGGEVAIKVIMWLDGEALNDNTQGAIASVALSIDPVAAPQQ